MTKKDISINKNIKIISIIWNYINIKNLCSQSRLQQRDKIYSPNTCGSNKTYGPQKSNWSKVRIAIFDVGGIWYPEYIGSVLLKRAILLFFPPFSTKVTRNFLHQGSGASRNLSIHHETTIKHRRMQHSTPCLNRSSTGISPFRLGTDTSDTYSNNWHRRGTSFSIIRRANSRMHE